MPPEEPDSPSYQSVENGHPTARSGRAILPNIVENIAVSPLGEPCPDDFYTITPHNADHDHGLSVSERSGKWPGGVYVFVCPSFEEAGCSKTNTSSPYGSQLTHVEESSTCDRQLAHGASLLPYAF